jgi:hypothetical protein
MPYVLKMRGSTKDVTITYEQMLAYHGQKHPGGVAVAFKALETALARLCPDGLPERDRIRLVVGVDGPGVVDGFECATRAFSRFRAVLDRSIRKGEAVCGEHFYFEVHYKGAGVALALKDGTLGAEFQALAAKHSSGTATPTEKASFDAMRRELADRVIATSGADLFDIAEVAA